MRQNGAISAMRWCGLWGAGMRRCCLTCCWRKMICCGQECLIDPVECRSSIYVLLQLLSPLAACLFPLSCFPLSCFPSALISAAGSRSLVAAAIGSAEVEKEAAAPSFPHWVVEERGRWLKTDIACCLIPCVSMIGYFVSWLFSYL